MVETYIEFLRFCLNPDLPLPDSAKGIDWKEMKVWAEQQAIVGVIYQGMERAGKRISVPFHVLMEWVGYAQQIEKRNVKMNKKCVELTEMLKRDGFECCILKGQGNALMYPDPYSRMSGDIDVFVLPGDNLNPNLNPNGNLNANPNPNPNLNGNPNYRNIVAKRRKVVMDYVKRMFPKTDLRYQHIDYPIYKDVEVEMHFIPTAMNNPVYNRRIQQWVEERMEEQCRHFVDLPGGVGRIAVPVTEFNVVYQLSHMMHHFFDEGIGLRQVVDYYYLLRKAKEELINLNPNLNGNLGHAGCGKRSVEGSELIETLKYLNLYRFAGSVMWVLHEVLGLDEQYMIAPMDEWRGRLLLEEILKGGNFGKYSGLTDHSMGTKYFLKIRRNMRFVRAYPAEALCEPWFRTWHFFWRKGHGWVRVEG